MHVFTAAVDAGVTRLVPVVMTALAWIIGRGEGAEQRAPLGRAVIGRRVLATVATLLPVPAVFAPIHGCKAPHAE